MRRLGKTAISCLLSAIILLTPLSLDMEKGEKEKCVHLIKSPDLTMVHITRPLRNALYLFDRFIAPFPGSTVIIGGITVDVMVMNPGIVIIYKLEFYIDGILKHTENVNWGSIFFYWNWDERVFFKHTLEVLGYSIWGDTVDDEIDVWIFNS